jgi:hypothetical protein
MQVLQRRVLDELVHAAGGHPVLEHLHEGDALHHHAFSDVGLYARGFSKREREKARLQLRAAATGDASRLPESRTLTARSDGERTTGARRNQPLCFVIMQPELRTRTVHDDEKREWPHHPLSASVPCTPPLLAGAARREGDEGTFGTRAPSE